MFVVRRGRTTRRREHQCAVVVVALVTEDRQPDDQCDVVAASKFLQGGRQSWQSSGPDVDDLLGQQYNLSALVGRVADGAGVVGEDRRTARRRPVRIIVSV